jgi:hypothetical protein
MAEVVPVPAPNIWVTTGSSSSVVGSSPVSPNRALAMWLITSSRGSARRSSMYLVNDPDTIRKNGVAPMSKSGCPSGTFIPGRTVPPSAGWAATGGLVRPRSMRDNPKMGARSSPAPKRWQVTSNGRGLAKSAPNRIWPDAMNSSTSALHFSRMYGTNDCTALGVNSRLIILRNRVCMGASYARNGIVQRPLSMWW